MNLQIADLEITDTAFQKYSLLKGLTWYFQEAGLEAKRKLLGSIFPTKLTFQDRKYRTDGLNPALAIILQKTKNLENEKCGDTSISENVSGDVHRTGLEPVTTRFEAGYSIRLSYRCIEKEGILPENLTKKQELFFYLLFTIT